MLPDGQFVSDAEPLLRGPGGTGVAATGGIDIVEGWFEELQRKGASR